MSTGVLAHQPAGKARRTPPDLKAQADDVSELPRKQQVEMLVASGLRRDTASPEILVQRVRAATCLNGCEFAPFF
jgi:hypothetical protein